ncbi:MAG: hypothetical protein PHI63_01780 [Patescibacteria group bacterium]|nr:hypothetical protein [Patescibacteria group bacterium]
MPRPQHQIFGVGVYRCERFSFESEHPAADRRLKLKKFFPTTLIAQTPNVQYATDTYA